jgi:hypothetical protein
MWPIMISTCRFILATTLTLLLSCAALADDDAQKRSLYCPVNILGFFTKDTKAELRISRDQEKRIAASHDKQSKIWRQYVDATVKVQKAKLSQRDENAKLRVLETQVAEELFKMYAEILRPEQLKRMRQIVLQVRGMELFDHPEIRDALQLEEEDIKVLRAAYDGQMHELAADVEAKKITLEDAARISSSMSFSVPDRVRESLSKEQRKILEDLLGEKYNYGK